MGNMISKTEKKVMFIPHYIVTAMKANKITFKDLEVVANNDVGMFDLFKNISKYDLIDLYIANTKLAGNLLYSRQLFNNIIYSLEDIIGYDYIRDNDNNTKYLEFINNLSSKSSILMSDNNNKELYSFEVLDSMLIVILHNGFTDMVIGNGNNDKETFLKKLVDKVFQSYGEREGISNTVTKAFIGRAMFTAGKKA